MPGMPKTMTEFAEGDLHSGSPSGPVVKNRQQAIAIGLNSARRAGMKVAPPAGSAPRTAHGAGPRPPPLAFGSGVRRQQALSAALKMPRKGY